MDSVDCPKESMSLLQYDLVGQTLSSEIFRSNTGKSVTGVTVTPSLSDQTLVTVQKVTSILINANMFAALFKAARKTAS